MSISFNVYIIYHQFCYIILACFVLITYIGGQETLYCTHEALIVALEDPSAFCQASGTEVMTMMCTKHNQPRKVHC